MSRYFCGRDRGCPASLCASSYLDQISFYLGIFALPEEREALAQSSDSDHPLVCTAALVPSPISIVGSTATARYGVAIWEGDGREREREWGGYLIDRERVRVRERSRSHGRHAPVPETKRAETERGRRWRSAKLVTQLAGDVGTRLRVERDI